jgi:hypothetical protein
MNESTNISDLPTDPVGGGSISNNISIKANEPNIASPTQSSNLSLDQSTINQIISGIQKASSTGATQLPSRDIPMTTTALSNDQQVQPNYIPSPPQNHVDYITDYENPNDIINNYNKKKQYHNTLDSIYDEIQTPLLLAVLYFLFQLPFFRKFLFSYFPVLFKNDGNFNINGFLFTSILFGFVFHLLNKITTHFSAF